MKYEFNCGRTMATAKEEENTTRIAQVLYVIRFQAPLVVRNSEEVRKYPNTV